MTRARALFYGREIQPGIFATLSKFLYSGSFNNLQSWTLHECRQRRQLCGAGTARAP